MNTLKILVWAIFSFREKEEVSLTEKTDIRDSDEKVVEIEMERLGYKKNPVIILVRVKIKIFYQENKILTKFCGVG